jgi:hypothetical protein
LHGFFLGFGVLALMFLLLSRREEFGVHNPGTVQFHPIPMHFGHNLGMLREERSPPVPKSTVNEIKDVDQGIYRVISPRQQSYFGLPYHIINDSEN